MPIRLMYATATLKARSYFTCSTCGVEAKGSTVTLTVEDDGVGEPELHFGQAIAGTYGNAMPVGWAGFGWENGKPVHRCPLHINDGYKKD